MRHCIMFQYMYTFFKFDIVVVLSLFFYSKSPNRYSAVIADGSGRKFQKFGHLAFSLCQLVIDKRGD